MKKLLNSLLLILLLGSLSACKSDFDPLEDGNHRTHREKEKPMMKTIRMSFGGDYINESEEYLMRADDGNTFVGINVFYTKKNEENAVEKPYAYGLFSSANGISIDLLTGFTYRFEATILIEREDKLYENGNPIKYAEPFLDNNGDSGGYFTKDNMGSFIYLYLKNTESQFYFKMLNKGTAYVVAGDEAAIPKGDFRFPRVKRFYGTLSGFDPSITTGVEIGMNYRSFGLKLVLKSIPGSSSVSVRDVTPGSINQNNNFKDPNLYPEYYLCFPKNLKLDFSSEESKTWEGIYSLNDLTTDTQQFKLEFTWNKGSGQTETFEHTFTAQAKKKKVLEISIDGEINETKTGNISFTNVDSTLTEETAESVKNVTTNK